MEELNLKRIATVLLLGMLNLGIIIIFMQSLIKQEIYGRYGTVIKMEFYPDKYWIGIILLLVMIALLTFLMVKTWREETKV